MSLFWKAQNKRNGQKRDFAPGRWNRLNPFDGCAAVWKLCALLDSCWGWGYNSSFLRNQFFQKFPSLYWQSLLSENHTSEYYFGESNYSGVEFEPIAFEAHYHFSTTPIERHTTLWHRLTQTYISPGISSVIVTSPGLSEVTDVCCILLVQYHKEQLHVVVMPVQLHTTLAQQTWHWDIALYKSYSKLAF